MAVPLILLIQNNEKGISIDGKFNDWTNEIFYEDSQTDQTENSNINIVEYAVSKDNTRW